MNVAPLLAQAAQLLKARRPQDAVTVLREVVRWMPRNAAILHDLGLACLESGQTSEAVTVLRSCLSIDPTFADAHLRLAIALESSGAAQAALAAYDRAMELSPTSVDASYRAANLLDSLGHGVKAIDLFRQVAAAVPSKSLGRIAMARALLAESRDAEAEKVLRKLIATEPDNAVALDLLGNTLADAGRFVEARRYFERAIQKAPGLAGSYYELVRCGRIAGEDEGLIERMRAALALPGLEPTQRIRVHLALGKAADDLGDYEEAMSQFDAAEAVRNGIVRFDLAKFEARVGRLISSFTPERLAEATSRGLDDASPIFIVGLPRSGTTLVEQILSTHPDVQAGGELAFWNEHGSAWERADSTNEQAEVLAQSAIEYLQLLRRLGGGAARVTDKMPFNFQWAGLIHLAFPKATIIHCVRRPLDTALSIHQTHFNPHMLFPTGGELLVGYVHAYQRLCAHWRGVLPPDKFIEINYEDLVEEPEPVIRRMVAACGLTWRDACLFPQHNDRVVKTPSKWQARQPIYRHAVDRWRDYDLWLGPLSALRS